MSGNKSKKEKKDGDDGARSSKTGQEPDAAKLYAVLRAMEIGEPAGGEQKFTALMQRAPEKLAQLHREVGQLLPSCKKISPMRNMYKYDVRHRRVDALYSTAHSNIRIPALSLAEQNLKEQSVLRALARTDAERALSDAALLYRLFESGAVARRQDLRPPCQVDAVFWADEAARECHALTSPQGKKLLGAHVLIKANDNRKQQQGSSSQECEALWQKREAALAILSDDGVATDSQGQEKKKKASGTPAEATKKPKKARKPTDDEKAKKHREKSKDSKKSKKAKSKKDSKKSGGKKLAHDCDDSEEEEVTSEESYSTDSASEKEEEEDAEMKVDRAESSAEESASSVSEKKKKKKEKSDKPVAKPAAKPNKNKNKKELQLDDDDTPPPGGSHVLDSNNKKKKHKEKETTKKKQEQKEVAPEKRKRDDAKDGNAATGANTKETASKKVKFSEAPKTPPTPTKKSGVSTSAASVLATGGGASEATAKSHVVAPQIRLEFARLNEWYDDALRRANTASAVATAGAGH